VRTKGATLLEQGKPVDALYLLLRGRCQVLHHHPDGGERLLRTLEEGDLFGEISLMLGLPATLALRAGDPGIHAGKSSSSLADRFFCIIFQLAGSSQVEGARFGLAARRDPLPLKTRNSMFRSPGRLNLLAVVALMGGCAGEGTATQELIPTSGDTITPVQDNQLTTIKQAIGPLGYSTYLGFGGDEAGSAIAVDASGNSYITGTTTTWGGINVFVAKMSPTGTNLYFTYFPGTQSSGIAVDGSGYAYVASTGAAGPTITKVDPSGTSIIYSATLGWNSISAVKVDSAGNAYLTGSVSNGPAGIDVAVGKVDPTGTGFVYALAFGGTGTDEGKAIDIDRLGNAYITGNTSSSNFPLANPFQNTLKGIQDAFVVKLNAAGSALTYSTYLGGNAYDYGSGIAVDSAYNAYVTGSTGTINAVQSFPVTTGMAQTTPGGGGDAFAAKFGSTGSRIYATYIGGSGSETGTSIAVSTTGIAYVTGYTNSTNFPTSNLAYQRFAPAGTNAFVAQLTASFNAYTYATYLGGSGTDTGAAIAVNASGNTFVTGTTNSTNFPTSVYGAGGLTDAFVTKFNP